VDADGDGVELAGEIKVLSPSTIIVIMTGEPTLENAIGSLKIGAIEYIVKPFSTDYLESLVRNAFEKSRLFSELEREKALKLELEEAYSQLKDSDRLKDAFLARINHELRTPLAVAMTANQVLGPELKEAHARKLWENSGTGLNNLKTIIEELLLFSGLLNGELKPKKKPCDLLPLLEASAQGTEFLYKSLGVHLEITQEGESAPLLADPEMMGVVFKQLLANAAKFSHRGKTVAARAVYLPDMALFHFADTGCGVSDDLLPHIFDGFFQAADHRMRNVGGLGLGLATVKRIVESHGGAVAALKNRAGPGLTVTVSLLRK